MSSQNVQVVPVKRKYNRNPSPATRFKKGQSGNPKGRRSSQDDMKSIIREFTSEHDPVVRTSRLRAILLNLYENKPEIILYLGWGKPTETHEVNVSHVVVDPELLEGARILAQERRRQAVSN